MSDFFPTLELELRSRLDARLPAARRRPSPALPRRMRMARQLRAVADRLDS